MFCPFVFFQISNPLLSQMTTSKWGVKCKPFWLYTCTPSQLGFQTYLVFTLPNLVSRYLYIWGLFKSAKLGICWNHSIAYLCIFIFCNACGCNGFVWITVIACWIYILLAFVTLIRSWTIFLSYALGIPLDFIAIFHLKNSLSIFLWQMQIGFINFYFFPYDL